MQHDLIGQELGNWRLVSHLGSSHCSDVYRACSQALEADQPANYVVKVVPAGADAWARRMLDREREILTCVSHPHVVSLLDAGQDEGYTYLVLPFLEGMLPPDGRTRGVPANQWSRVAWVARQIASGLRAIHVAGWCHGDLKPVHISVDRFLHVTLIDLGLARPVSLRGQREANDWSTPSGPVERWTTRKPALLGSPPYLAPEVFLQQQSAGPAQDIYALGCLLYHWFTGVRPFQARSLDAWKRAHVRARPVPPSKWAPELPSFIGELLLKMLAKQPQRRPDLDEVDAALVRLELQGLGAWLAPERSLLAA